MKRVWTCLNLVLNMVNPPAGTISLAPKSVSEWQCHTLAPPVWLAAKVLSLSSAAVHLDNLYRYFRNSGAILVLLTFLNLCIFCSSKRLSYHSENGPLESNGWHLAPRPGKRLAGRSVPKLVMKCIFMPAFGNQGVQYIFQQQVLYFAHLIVLCYSRTSIC